MRIRIILWKINEELIDFDVIVFIVIIIFLRKGNSNKILILVYLFIKERK